MVLFWLDLGFVNELTVPELKKVCVEITYILPCGIAWVIKAGLWISLFYVIQGNTQISTFGPAFWPHHDSTLGQSPPQPEVSLKQKQDVHQMQSVSLSIVRSIWKKNQHPGVSYSILHPSADRQNYTLPMVLNWICQQRCCSGFTFTTLLSCMWPKFKSKASWHWQRSRICK